MPSPPEHQQQAAQNEVAYEAMRRASADLPDWEITTTFYTAVHEIRAYISRRDASLRGPKLPYSEFPRILESYGEDRLSSTFEQLKDWSQKARYYCKGNSWCQGHVDYSREALRKIRHRIKQLNVELDSQGIPPEGR